MGSKMKLCEGKCVGNGNNEKSTDCSMLFLVGVEGFEPPTLCL